VGAANAGVDASVSRKFGGCDSNPDSGNLSDEYEDDFEE
jgi:hypothetical protein